MKIFLLLYLLLCSSVFAQQTLILSLHSYHESYQWTQEQYSGFRKSIDSVENLSPSYSTEYMDTKRIVLDSEYEKELVRYLTSKYRGYIPDIIYVTDDNALNFMINHKEKLFPFVPVVYSGVNSQSTIDSLDKTSYIGIKEEKEIIPNIKLIKKLFPHENKILIIGDGSLTADAIHRDIQIDNSIASGIDIEYINNKELQYTLNKLKEYSGKIIILSTIGGFRSNYGLLMPLKKTIENIAEKGFFVFSMEDVYIQQGVIGGYVVDGINSGVEAGKLALEILSNAAIIPHNKKINTNSWIFDINALKKYNITLPEDIAQKSQFINLPETFYQKNEDLIIVILYVMLAVIIFGTIVFSSYLYYSRRIIAQRENKLIVLTDSFRKAQEIAKLGSWEWDMKANTLWWSDEIYRIFGLQPKEFKANYESFIEYVHPEDRELVQNAVNEAIAEHKDYNIVHRIIRKDGEIRHVSEEGQIEFQDEQPIKMLGTVHDISEEIEIQQKLEKSEKKYKSLVENSIIGVYRSNLDGTITYVNSAVAKLLCYDSVDEVIGQNFLPMYTSPQQREHFIKKLFKQKHITNYEIEFRDKNDVPLPVILNATLDGDTISGMIIDMREIKQSRAEVDKLSKAIEQIDDSVVITDTDGVITYVNQAFSTHSGFSKNEALGKTPRILNSGQHDNSFYKKLWQTILSGKVYKEIIINKKKNNDIYYEKQTITPLKDDNNNIIAFVSIGKDVTSETLMHEETKYIASTDKLTGLFNRHKFEELYLLEKERAQRFSSPLSLILIDIDNFKLINDKYGHDVGDAVLIYITKILQANIRVIDILARWGGEEFLILCPNTDLKNTQFIAEKLRLKIENEIFETVKHATISLGISTLKKDDTLADLFKRADEGLYNAKANGRNQIGIII